MDARNARGAAVLAVALVMFGTGAGYKTANFIVMAPTPQLAEKIGRMAEQYRHTLAIAWTGKPMPDWSQPCPITAKVSPRLGAGGETSFVFDRNEVYGWQMKIQGTEERVLDSVLPHEVSHTIFASYFRQPMPRWADEGACTTVEHESERSKQHKLLDEFLRTERGIPFAQMFAMKQYPQDILPLYAQGYSLARYLIQQGGRHKFVAFLGQGMRNEQWATAIRENYGYKSLGELQNSWLQWVGQGSPTLATAGADSQEGPPTEINWPERDAKTLVARNQSPDNTAASQTRANVNAAPLVEQASYNAALPRESAPREPVANGLAPLIASDTSVRSLEELPPAAPPIQLPAVGANSEYMASNPRREMLPPSQSASSENLSGPTSTRGRSIYERHGLDERGSQPLGQAAAGSAATGPGAPENMARGNLNPSSRGTPVMPAGFTPNAPRGNPAPNNSSSLTLPGDRSANLASVAEGNPGPAEAAPRVLVQWGEPREALDVKW
jgi:hypothetical protein